MQKGRNPVSYLYFMFMTCIEQLTNDAISRIPYLNHLTKHPDLHCYPIIHLASRYHINVLSKEYKIKIITDSLSSP